MTTNERAAWVAARPAAARVPLLSFIPAVLAAAAVPAGLTMAGLTGLAVLSIPLAGLVGWWLGRRALAAWVVRDVAPALRAHHLSAPHIAELIARGATTSKGVRWRAVVDADTVILTTSRGTDTGTGTELPLSTITNLGNSGGGL